MKSGNPNFLETSGPLQADKVTALPYFTVYFYKMQKATNKPATDNEIFENAYL